VRNPIREGLIFSNLAFWRSALLTHHVNHLIASTDLLLTFDPGPLFPHYFSSLGVSGIALPASKDRNMWFLSVLSISEARFVICSEQLQRMFIVIRETPDDIPPLMKI